MQQRAEADTVSVAQTCGLLSGMACVLCYTAVTRGMLPCVLCYTAVTRGMLPSGQLIAASADTWNSGKACNSCSLILSLRLSLTSIAYSTTPQLQMSAFFVEYVLLWSTSGALQQQQHHRHQPALQHKTLSNSPALTCTMHV